MDRIDKIFHMIDDYIGKESFQSLNLEQIKELIIDFGNTRRYNSEMGVTKDAKLADIEKELMNLRARMINNNLTTIYR